tara:strand:+ start:192 stop:857 length:666 start_codon:yes stop_codon:yes gene_type:complete
MSLQTRVPYHWNRVRAGDIVSFRYKSSKTKRKAFHTILVLNPKINIKGEFYFIGIKLEDKNVPTFRITPANLRILNLIGKFVALNKKQNLYQLQVFEHMLATPLKGTRQIAYKQFKKQKIIRDNYRTYLFTEAKKSTVYKEPIIIPKAVKRILLEEDKVKPDRDWENERPDMNWTKQEIKDWMEEAKIKSAKKLKKDLLKDISKTYKDIGEGSKLKVKKKK